MERPLAKLKLLISLLSCLSTAVIAGAEPVQALSQKELSQPESVRQWLLQNSDKADKKIAQEYFEMGDKEVQKKYWSAATKAYGESALAFPAPKTLYALTTAKLKMIAKIRARNKGPNTEEKSDLEHFTAMYKTTLAADDVLHTFTDEEREQVNYAIKCIEQYLENAALDANCKPLQDYGLVQ